MRGALDELRNFEGIGGGFANGQQSVIGDQYRTAIREVACDFVPEFFGTRHFVLRHADVATDVDIELFNDARDRLVRDGKHGAVGGMGVHDCTDVGVIAQAGEVESLLGCRRARAFDDRAFEIADDHVARAHGFVREGGRRHDDVAIGKTRRDVARSAFDKARGNHLFCGGKGRKNYIVFAQGVTQGLQPRRVHDGHMAVRPKSDLEFGRALWPVIIASEMLRELCATMPVDAKGVCLCAAVSPGAVGPRRTRDAIESHIRSSKRA
ncbi:MAG: hypothetical protein ACI8W3_002383 [Myxococcota bacterium]